MIPEASRDLTETQDAQLRAWVVEWFGGDDTANDIVGIGQHYIVDYGPIDFYMSDEGTVRGTQEVVIRRRKPHEYPGD